MTITTRRVVGTIALPDGTAPRMCRAEMTLTGQDAEGGTQIIYGPVRVEIGDTGIFDANLWVTDEGSAGRVYNGVLHWHDGTQRRSLPFLHSVKSGAGDHPFTPVWTGDLSESTQADALAQAQAAAARAAQDAEQTAQDREIAERAAAAVVSSVPRGGNGIGDGVAASFVVPGAYESPRQIIFVLGGQTITPDRYITAVATDRLTTTVTWLGDAGDASTPLPSGMEYFWRGQVNNTVDVAQNGFTTRAALIAAIAAGYSATSGTVIAAGGVSYEASVGATAISDLPDWVPHGVPTPAHFGADTTGASDCTAQVQAWIDYCQGREGFWAPGNYRINGTLYPRSYTTIKGVKGEDAGAAGTFIQQLGQVLFQGTPDLKSFVFTGATFRLYASGVTGWTKWANFDAHQNCNLSQFRFVGYQSATIIERDVTNQSTNALSFNRYEDWDIEGCLALDVAIGYDPGYTRMDGDGNAAVVATGHVWPECLPSSVVVLSENASRVFTELTYGTDYAVAFDGSGKLTVALAIAPAAGVRIHVWASQPQETGRIPISNNNWANISVKYLFSRGWQGIRWIDAETHTNCRLVLAANGAKGFVMNPYLLRTGQGGGYLALDDCELSFVIGMVTDIATCLGMDFGPGCNSMSGKGLRGDMTWVKGGVNYIYSYRSGRRVTLTGTVSGVNGSAVITGTGTKFTQELSLLSPDVIELNNGIARSIASIDSDTQITLSAALPASLTNVPAARVTKECDVDARLDFASLGNGFLTTRSAKSGVIVTNSARQRSGAVTIPTGATSINITHNLDRTPRAGEISLTPHGAITPYISAMTATTFTISVPSAVAAATTVGWMADLKALN